MNDNSNDYNDTEHTEHNKHTGFKKLSKSQWTLIEKEIDNNTKKVIQVLSSLGGDNIVEKYNLQTIGNIYLKIRPQLVENELIDKSVIVQNVTPFDIDNIVKETKVQKNSAKLKEVLQKYNIVVETKNQKNKKTGLNKEQIIEKNIVSNITTIINSLLEIKNDDYSTGFRSPYAEMRLITFLFHIRYLRFQNLESECYEVIIGITKLLNDILSIKEKLNTVKKDIIVKELINDKKKIKKDDSLEKLLEEYDNYTMFDNINIVLCNDLKQMCDILKQSTSFNFKQMFSKYPRLCLSTNYDDVFPNMNVKPYPSQIELIEKLKQSELVDGFSGLYMYGVLPNSGKTMNAVAVGKLVQNTRIKYRNLENSRFKSLQLLFACNIEPVRIEVAKVLFHAKIPFGIASTGDDGKLKIINNYNCQKKDENRIAIVADLQATLQLLTAKNQELAEKDINFRNYILFLDEPTLCADIENHPITRTIVKIVINAPKCTILSSATLPNIDEIHNIVTHYKKSYPDAQIYSIRSTKTLIGCHVVGTDGSSITPYMKCHNKETLKNTIELLKVQPFISRLLSAPIIYDLQNKMLEKNIENVIPLEQYFESCKNLCQSEIEKVGILLLERLLLEDDLTIKQVCTSPVLLNVVVNSSTKLDNETSDSDDGFEWDEEETVNIDNSFNTDKIFTEHAFKFSGPCLITDMDPNKFVFERINFLLNKCPKAVDLITNYYQELETLEAQREKLDKEPNKVDKETRRNILEEKRAKKMILDNKRPKIKFPNVYKINTIHHANYFAKGYQFDMKTLRASFNPEILPLDLYVPDWKMLALFAGIGIYSPSIMSLNNKNYNDTILELARNKDLAFLVSDDNICYGTNYPFSHLYVSDNIMDTHSMNTLFQLFGRVGRVGESWSATIVVTDKIKNMLLNYDNSLTSVEALNMNSIFNSLTQTKTKQNKIQKSQVYFCKEGKDIQIKSIVINDDFNSSETCIDDDLWLESTNNSNNGIGNNIWNNSTLGNDTSTSNTLGNDTSTNDIVGNNTSTNDTLGNNKSKKLGWSNHKRNYTSNDNRTNSHTTNNSTQSGYNNNVKSDTITEWNTCSENKECKEHKDKYNTSNEINTVSKTGWANHKRHYVNNSTNKSTNNHKFTHSTNSTNATNSTNSTVNTINSTNNNVNTNSTNIKKNSTKQNNQDIFTGWTRNKY